MNVEPISFFLGVGAAGATALAVTPVWRHFRHRCVCGGKTKKEVICHRLQDVEGQARVRVFSFRLCQSQDCEIVTVGGGVKSYSFHEASKLRYDPARLTELCRLAGVPGIIEGVTTYRLR